MSAKGEQALLSWLREEGLAARFLEALAGDVSTRRYYRAESHDGRSIVAVRYPSDQRATCPRFVATSELLAAAGIRVPALLAVDCDRGFMALEDAGPRTLAEIALGEWRRADAWYPAAVSTARKIGRLDTAAVASLNPPLDSSRLRWELDQTISVFLRPSGGLGRAGRRFVETLFDDLCARIGADGMVPCHRDFMVRNLVPGARAGDLVVLDHQDLRLGPPAYDLASLLNDTLFPDELRVARLLGGEPDEQFHRTAAQRALKAVGTYAGAASRGNRRHLPLLRPTLERALGHLALLPESAGEVERLRAAWT